MEKKYYKVALSNIFDEGSKKECVYAVLENNELHELLTNKKIYLSEFGYFDKDIFLSNNYDIVGIAYNEVDKSEVSVFLKFITLMDKERVIERIKDIENNIFMNINGEIKRRIKKNS